MGTGKQYDEEIKKQAISSQRRLAPSFMPLGVFFFVSCIILQFTCPNLTKVRQWSIM